MQCEKEIGPVDAPDVTAFSEQRSDVADIIDFQQERIVAAIFGRLYERSGSGIARVSGGAALWRQKNDGEAPMGVPCGRSLRKFNLRAKDACGYISRHLPRGSTQVASSQKW